ncbi:hypothetical protein J1N35_028858, partial [Gossypium stocksii]
MIWGYIDQCGNIQLINEMKFDKLTWEQIRIKFISLLEYSQTKDVAYCLPCYLFNMKPVRQPSWDVFTIKGFTSWEKNNFGKNFVFHNHIGDDPCSPHDNAMKSCANLIKQSEHIDKVMHQQSSQRILNNMLQIKISIDDFRRLASQACDFRASYDGDVKNVVLENASKTTNVDEAHDESKREQMAFVLRFVNRDGFIREHFFDLAH